jgi:hypothetical protein
MQHEASTENIVLRILYRADHGDSAASSETHDSMNNEKMCEAPGKPAWAKSIPQRRLRWLLKQHPRMNVDQLWLWAN